MKRLAVLVGCNYPNLQPEYNLHGCINDVNAMKPLLISRFGFVEADIQVLTDEPTSEFKPTKDNIGQALQKMIDQAAEGDVLFFFFAGHGTRIPKPHEADKYDEAILPCDLNLINDVDIGELVEKVPNGATFTILADSCNSGGLIDNEKEQIGPPEKATGASNAQKPRFMPIEAIIGYLKTITGIESSDIGTLSFAAFGDKASIKFRPQALLERLDHAPVDVGILLSACQANEFAGEKTVGDMMNGIFTDAVLTAFNYHKLPYTNHDLVMTARKTIQEEGYTLQHPCLYCTDANAGATFLLQPK